LVSGKLNPSNDKFISSSIFALYHLEAKESQLDRAALSTAKTITFDYADSE